VYLHPLTLCVKGLAAVVYIYVLSFPLQQSTMAVSIFRAATAIGLFLPSVVSFALPSVEQLTPRVPEVSWKKSGLWSGYERRDGYKTNCNHGPQSRGCWDGDFSIDTDMDAHWPNTGKTVKYHMTISNSTQAPDGFERPVLLINGQTPGPVSTLLETRSFLF
jgi:hypothetical protein